MSGPPRALGSLLALTCALVVTTACAGQGARVDDASLRSARGDRALELDVLLRAGRRLAREGDSVRAEHYLLAAIDRGAPRSEVVPLLVTVCLAGSRLRAALDHAEPYLRTHPGDAELRFLVATIYLGLGRLIEARSILEGLLLRHPEHIRAHYVLGSLLARQLAEPASALEHFERYLELSPRGQHEPEVRGWLLDHTSSPNPLAPGGRAEWLDELDAAQSTTGDDLR